MKVLDKASMTIIYTKPTLEGWKEYKYTSPKFIAVSGRIVYSMKCSEEYVTEIMLSRGKFT